jgi:hypothetical protein
LWYVPWSGGSSVGETLTNIRSVDRIGLTLVSLNLPAGEEPAGFKNPFSNVERGPTRLIFNIQRESRYIPTSRRSFSHPLILAQHDRKLKLNFGTVEECASAIAILTKHFSDSSSRNPNSRLKLLQPPTKPTKVWKSPKVVKSPKTPNAMRAMKSKLPVKPMQSRTPAASADAVKIEIKEEPTSSPIPEKSANINPEARRDLAKPQVPDPTQSRRRRMLSPAQHQEFKDLLEWTTQSYRRSAGRRRAPAPVAANDANFIRDFIWGIDDQETRETFVRLLCRRFGDEQVGSVVDGGVEGESSLVWDEVRTFAEEKFRCRMENVGL